MMTAFIFLVLFILIHSIDPIAELLHKDWRKMPQHGFQIDIPLVKVICQYQVGDIVVIFVSENIKLALSNQFSKLTVVKLVVKAFFSEQVFVLAPLNNLAILHH